MHVPRPGRQRERDLPDAARKLLHAATLSRSPIRTHVLYSTGCEPEYRIEPCKSALNPVRGMPFKWSLNPYMGCVHRCTFCYVRNFELRADRPSDDRYGRSIRVKTNVAEVLARELGRTSWTRDEVAVGTATDPYQPAEGRFRLTRACLEELGKAWTPFSIITRGPLVVRDVDVLARGRPARRRERHLLPPHPRRGRLADDRARHRAAARAGSKRCAVSPRPASTSESGSPRSCPGSPTVPSRIEAVVRAAKAAGARGVWAAPVHLRPGVREHFLEALARDWPELVGELRRTFRGALLSPVDDRDARSASACGRRARAAPIPEQYRRTERKRHAEPAQLTLAV